MGGRAQKWVEQIKGEGIAMLAVAGAGVPNGAVQKPVLKRATVTRAGSPEMKAMLLFSTTTGNTETAAGYIAAATGLEATDIGDVDVETIKECVVAAISLLTTMAASRAYFARMVMNQRLFSACCIFG